MNRLSRALLIAAFGISGAVYIGGCVEHHHDHGNYAQVDVVDDRGYHHQGYYDETHVWHGGWTDENHTYHQDPNDWHH